MVRLREKLSREQDTRDRVLRAAAELFATRGYAATSISAIRETSGVLPSSIYWEFGSKEGIFAAVLEDSAKRWLEESSRGIARAMRETESEQRLAGYFRYMADALAARPEFLRLMLLMALERREGDEASLEMVRAHRRQAVEGLARLFVAGGIVDADAPPGAAEDIARLSIACFDGAFAAAQIDGGEADLRRMFELLQGALIAVSQRESG